MMINNIFDWFNTNITYFESLFSIIASLIAIVGAIIAVVVRIKKSVNKKNRQKQASLQHSGESIEADSNRNDKPDDTKKPVRGISSIVAFVLFSISLIGAIFVLPRFITTLFPSLAEKGSAILTDTLSTITFYGSLIGSASFLVLFAMDIGLSFFSTLFDLSDNSRLSISDSISNLCMVLLSGFFVFVCSSYIPKPVDNITYVAADHTTISDNSLFIELTDRTVLDCRDGMKTVRIPSEIGTLPHTAVVSAIGTIGNDSEKFEAFSNIVSLEEVILPDTICLIGDEAFSGCTNLRKVNIPEKVKYIGEGAFSDCISLKEIVLPGSIDEIASTAFSGCTITIYAPYDASYYEYVPENGVTWMVQ